MAEHILITGGAGFVGSSLALAFRAERSDTTVTVMDNLHRRGSEKNLERLAAAGVRFVKGDVRRRKALEGTGMWDLVIDCAAEPSALAGVDGSPRYAIDTNLVGTVNTLEAARARGARLLFVSTSRVYPYTRLRELPLENGPDGFCLAGPVPFPGCSRSGVNEDFPLDGARTLYGATKLCSELLIREYAEMYGMNAVVLRCGLIAGPWQFGRTDQGVVALWVARHLFGEELTAIGFGGRGDQIRDVLHIADFARLVLRISTDFDVFAGGTFNVGGGPDNAVSLRTLTELCRRITGRTIPVGSDPRTRPGDIPWYVTDAGRIHDEAGWRPQRSVHDTVADIAAWMRRRHAELEELSS